MTELPQLETEPGAARPFYTGHPRTDTYVADALRALGEILFDASVPPDRVLSPQALVNQDGYHNLMLAFPTDKAPAGSVGILPGDGDGPSQRLHYRQDSRGSTALAERRSNDRPPAVQANELGTLPPQSDQPRFQTFNAPQNPLTSFSDASVRDDSPSISLHVGSPPAPGGRFATFPVKGKRKGSLAVVGETDSLNSTFSEQVQQGLTADVTDPSPRYEDIEGVHIPPPAPPPGAAPPTMPHAGLYGSYDTGSYNSGRSYVPENAEEETQLAYMEPPQSEKRVRFGSRPIQVPRPLSGELPSGRAQVSTEFETQNNTVHTPLASSPVSPQASAPQDRIPSPSYATEEPEDERALNAAAAREVSREFDALMYSPPVAPSRDPPFEPSSPISLTVPPATHPSPRSSTSSTHPSPFARTRGSHTSGSPTTPGSTAEQPPSNSDLPSQSTPPAPSSPTQQALPPPSAAFPPSSPPLLSSVDDTPFRTPPEIPSSTSPANSQRPLPQPPVVTASPGKTPSLPPPGARTISAAAFRRPVPRMVSEPVPSTPDTSPLSIKKRDSRPSPPFAPRIGDTFGSGSTSSLLIVQPPETSSSQPQERKLEDEFDYISAYYISGADDVTPPVPTIEPRGRSSSLR
jgi:hypothetical protein